MYVCNAKCQSCSHYLADVSSATLIRKSLAPRSLPRLNWFFVLPNKNETPTLFFACKCITVINLHRSLVAFRALTCKTVSERQGFLQVKVHLACYKAQFKWLRVPLTFIFITCCLKRIYQTYFWLKSTDICFAAFLEHLIFLVCKHVQAPCEFMVVVRITDDIYFATLNGSTRLLN